jgi:hypothetical protein
MLDLFVSLHEEQRHRNPSSNLNVVMYDIISTKLIVIRTILPKNAFEFFHTKYENNASIHN